MKMAYAKNAVIEKNNKLKIANLNRLAFLI